MLRWYNASQELDRRFHGKKMGTDLMRMLYVWSDQGVWLVLTVCTPPSLYHDEIFYLLLVQASELQKHDAEDTT
jgi:hypothetical protein